MERKTGEKRSREEDWGGKRLGKKGTKERLGKKGTRRKKPRKKKTRKRKKFEEKIT